MIVAGLLVRAVPGAVGDLAGGILYAVFAFILIAVLVPAASTLRIGTAAFVLCVGVELLQLTGLPSTLGAAVPPLRFVLGSTFVATDLLAYAIGAGCAVLTDIVLRRRRA